MHISSSSHHKALHFLKTGEMEGLKRSGMDPVDGKFSDQQLSDQMRDLVAIDMERVRGDQDERFGHIDYRPNSDNSQFTARVYGDEKEGGFIKTVKTDTGTKATFAEFTADSVRQVVVFETEAGTSFRPQHLDRNQADNGYFLV